MGSISASFCLDSKKPTIPLKDYAYNEIRYKMLTRSKPEEARRLMEEAQQDVEERWRVIERLAAAPAEAPVEQL